jgi:uncharacterized membrane protein YcaP (DUF421 family)
MAQATPFDFVYAIMLGGILKSAIYDNQISILNVIFAYAIWSILIYIKSIVQSADKLRKPLKGEPSHIIINGRINIREMKRTKMETEHLRLMLRQQGIFS